MSPTAFYLVLALNQALATLPPASPEIPPVIASPQELEALAQWMDTSNKEQLAEALLDQLIERVRVRYDDRLTFLVIERQPDLHLRVGLKGDTPAPDQRVAVGGTPVRIKFQVGYPYNQEEYRAFLSRIHETIVKLIPDVSGVSGQSHRDAIEIHVEGTNKQDYQHAVAQIETLSGMKVELRLGMPRARNL